MPEELNLKRIKDSLKGDFISQDIIILNEVDSTQKYAFDNIQNLKNGSLIIAETQTQGQGRLGRVWHSPKRQGIYMSIVLKDNFNPVRLGQLTLLISLSLTKYLKSRYSLDFRVRWPNDVLAEGKKIAGVLAEIKEGNLIIGIGLNVGQNLLDLPQNATSLYLLLGQEEERNIIISGFLNDLANDFNLWVKEGYAYLKKLWLKYAYLKGREISAQTTFSHVRGVVIDLGEDCGLIIRGNMGYHIELNVNELIRIY